MTKERMTEIRELCNNASTNDVKELIRLYKRCLKNRDYNKAREIYYGLSVIYENAYIKYTDYMNPNERSQI